MDSTEILNNLKELTLDLTAGKRQLADTVVELHRRIEANLIYDMDEKEPQRDYITQVYVSLDNLTDPDFPPSKAELQYFAECFEGKREFNLEEVRQFELVSTETPFSPEKERRKNYRNFSKPRNDLKQKPPKKK